MPRWVYRFENYKRAFSLLREAIGYMDGRELSQLEKEGVIQRFEYTMELAWKVMRDYLESENVVFEQITPKAVIREAFESRFVSDGQLWMDMLDARNLMSHSYDQKDFEEVIDNLRHVYLGAFTELHTKLLRLSSR
jgi:nucleotidyltransferase substrate binding protein (TIGR01987 family)